MKTKRFELALDRLQSADWAAFERLASTFLAAEFDELRTVASPSGDGGRDSELFAPVEDPKVLSQYSVSKDWRAKVNATVRRLKDTFPDALVLMYVTNQQIGADADDLKKTFRTKHGLSLDIRDKSWFCERVNESQSRQIAAEELAHAIVDPYLASYEVTPHVSAELNTPEAIAALTFLGLQWQDDVREKGLTKLAFEAMVRSALIGTSSDNRISKAELYSRIEKVFPRHKTEELRIHVDTAISRLGKGAIKSWPGGEYCLSHIEVVRFKEFMAANALAETELMESIKSITKLLTSVRGIPLQYESELSRLLRAVMDAVLFERSQSFALAVQTGSLGALADADFKSTIISELAKSTLHKEPQIDWLSVVQLGVRELLLSEEPPIQAYLRSLADSYTLMAFLQQTPDVQRAVEKMFSHGTLWLDTTVVLPLISDTLLSSEDSRGRFTRMIDTALDVGLKLFVTPGVIEEIERHMNRSLTCARMPSAQWQGAIPYLLERFVSSGRSIGSFTDWLSNFRGDSRPTQDLSEYLHETFGIETLGLEEESRQASTELRSALQKIWLERYERRQEKYGVSLDDMAISRLVSHDIECYTGVVQKRIQERASPFGYSAWWLTVDRQTFDLKNRLRSMMNEPPPDSPVMSADFLVNYLAIGPLRRKVNKTDESHLPLLMILGNASQLTPELIAEAGTIREQFKDLPERLIRRHVRDGLDRAKASIGPIANQGMDAIEDLIQS
ncbi:hypothetical protein ACIOWE_10310 [Pseudomonas sp. NPDC087598]|uniref:hypothetical protein n=1 Tax=Pseudomonas sp. NPDC087598 TaxID=3364440 RepID=UPI003830055B